MPLSDEPSLLWSTTLHSDEHATTAYVVEEHANIDPLLRVLGHAPPDVVEFARCIVITTATRSSEEAARSSQAGPCKTVLILTLPKTTVGGAPRASSMHAWRPNHLVHA